MVFLATTRRAFEDYVALNADAPCGCPPECSLMRRSSIYVLPEKTSRPLRTKSDATILRFLQTPSPPSKSIIRAIRYG